MTTTPKWKVTINGEAFERRARSPGDALQFAMRKYLAGPTTRVGTTKVRVRDPDEIKDGENVVGIVNVGGVGRRLTPVYPNDDDAGAPIHRLFSDYAIFVEHIDEGEPLAVVPLRRRPRRPKRVISQSAIPRIPTQGQADQLFGAGSIGSELFAAVSAAHTATADRGHGPFPWVGTDDGFARSLWDEALHVIPPTFGGRPATEETVHEVASALSSWMRDRGVNIDVRWEILHGVASPDGRMSVRYTAVFR